MQIQLKGWILVTYGHLRNVMLAITGMWNWAPKRFLGNMCIDHCFFLQKIVKNVVLEYIRVLKSVYTKTFSKAEIKSPSLTSSRKIANPPNSYVVLYWPVSLILDNFWSLWLCGVSRKCGLWPKEKTPREYVNWSFWFLQILVNCS